MDLETTLTMRCPIMDLYVKLTPHHFRHFEALHHPLSKSQEITVVANLAPILPSPTRERVKT